MSLTHLLRRGNSPEQHSTSGGGGSQSAPVQRGSLVYRLALGVALTALLVYYLAFADRGRPAGVGGVSPLAAVEKQRKSSSNTQTVDQHAQLCREGDAFRYLLSNTHSQARCLDGSRPAFYLRKGHGEGRNKWFVFFEGGGWCFDLKACQQRSLTTYGSSRLYPRCISRKSQRDYLSADPHHSPLTHNWNVVHVKYCDGTSYASDTEASYASHKLFFKGKHNRDETIRSLLSLGMRNASEVLVGGCSAGALAVYLGLDEMAEIVHEQNPQTAVRGLALSGFFAEHSAMESIPANTVAMRDDGVANNRLDYANALRKVFLFANMSAGANKRCTRFYSRPSTAALAVKEGTNSSEYNALFDASLQFVGANGSSAYADLSARQVAKCAFAANLAPHIRTPLFSVQPQYDQWQVLHVLGRSFNVSAVNAFGRRARQEMLRGFHYENTETVDLSADGAGEKTVSLSNPGHGSFIESCAHHCTSCSVDEDTWSGIKFLASTPDKVPPAVALKDWFKKSIHSYNFSYPLSQSTFGSFEDIVVSNKSMLFLQNFPYPCHHCCKCTVRNLPYLPSPRGHRKQR